MRALILISLVACTGEKAAESTGESVFDQGDDPVSESGCPADVPEDYLFLWDCENAEGCSSKLYRYAIGESDASGNISLTEQWFLFNGPDDYCIDTFQIEGEWLDVTPETFDCSSCEGVYEVQWELTESQCGIMWSSLFGDQEPNPEDPQTYSGYLLLDTHTAFRMRNEDYGVLVKAAPGGNDYGRGTAIPTDPNAVGPDETDPNAGEQQAEEYEWTTQPGICLQ